MDKERNGGKRRRESGEGGARTATEEEVEEFFAILRRIREAERHFGGGRKVTVTEKGARWRPTFEWEDFAGVNGIKTEGEKGEKKEKGGKKEEEEGEDGGLELDLNVEPEPEQAAHVS